MRNPQQQERSNWGNMRSSANLLYLLACAHSTCITVFTRRSFGVATLGINGAAAFALLLGVICFTGSSAMARFLFVWFAAVAIQCAIMFIRSWRGQYEHSRYEGYPWLGFMVPFVRRVEGAKLWEMMFCLVAGTFLLGVDEVLGTFVFCGLFSLMGKAAIEGQIEQNRVQRTARFTNRDAAVGGPIQRARFLKGESHVRRTETEPSGLQCAAVRRAATGQQRVRANLAGVP